MNALIRTARPKQWTKNVLVFAAPGAAGVLDEPRQFGLTCLAFVAMCLASSARGLRSGEAAGAVRTPAPADVRRW